MRKVKSEEIEVRIKKCHPEAAMPYYSTDGSAGFDLYAVEDVVIPPGEFRTIRLGLAFEIPPGWQIEIRPRSGLSFKTNLMAKNTVGTIDSDYRGEVCFSALNTSQEFPFTVDAATRICQGVLMPAPKARFIETSELSETKRGENGFGSTGAE